MNESWVEEAAIEYLRELGYVHAAGAEIAPDGSNPERASYGDVVLVERLRAALARINPHLDVDTLDDVVKRVLRPSSPSLEDANLAFQGLLTRGVEVQVKADAGVRGDQAWLVDFDKPDNNDWLVVSQITVVDGKHTRRPDLVVYLNGLPVAVLELKNPTDEDATLESAWNQLQTYKAQIPSLFLSNELLVISDGFEARVGSLTAGFERFGPWRTVDGEGLAPSSAPRLEVLVRGLFDKRRLLDYIRHFVLWETDDRLVKKIAGYHQFHAVRKAVEQTVRASRPGGDKRVGVIWHTQGSGKSILMAFYAGRLILHPEMQNPTLVVVTDRNDLDGQLFAQFCAAKGLLPQPVQAKDREHLKELLKVASGGIVFTTIQKFGVPKGERFPELSNRRNIVVITDEAHRSQYDFVDGFARNLRDALPNASFIGFTGTPIEAADVNTRAVFGDYIDTYTISRAVEDKATVPILYEARMARIELPEERKPKVDEDFEEVTEGEEDDAKGKLKSSWSKIEAMVGTEERLALVARDIVEHFERRTEILDGKAMIVTMSRRIAVDLYEQIVKLRPEWAGTGDDDGAIKVVMTGSAKDPAGFQQHLRSKPDLKAIERRFKEPADPLKLVIVRDMWLTGFDAPCAHTLYVDKPMRGHGLMQAIARVNRVFRDKPAGLVVDYLGLAEHLRKAVSTYDGDERERPGVDVDVAFEVLSEQFGVVKDMFHGFDYGGYFSAEASKRMAALSGGADHICGRQVAPLSEEQRKRLATIFASWRHPRTQKQAARAAVLGDGSEEHVLELLKRLEAFVVADVGRDNEKLYEVLFGALHRLLVEPSPGEAERDSATRELVLQIEPFAFKLLALVDPDRWQTLQGKRNAGLNAALVQLSAAGANPYTLDLTEKEFVDRVGGDSWSSLEHAVRDVMGSRLDVAHRSTVIEPHTWRSAVCLVLALVDHNLDRMPPPLATPPRSSEGKKRFLDGMARLNKAAAIAIHLEEARDMRDEVGYFQAVQASLRKYTLTAGGQTQAELDAAIKQIVSQAIASEGVVDIFGAAGIDKPDLSILSEEFLETVRESPRKNLQAEVLQKLLHDEIRALSRRNLVQGRTFSEMLERTIRRYQNRSIEAAQIIVELIDLARQMREAPQRGDALGLSEDEMAFYDALVDHGGVRELMSDDVLGRIAHDLVEAIRGSVTIDWTQKEAVRADMRRKVKRLLRKHGYPPDKQAAAVDTVIEQAETVCKEWAQIV